MRVSRGSIIALVVGAVLVAGAPDPRPAAADTSSDYAAAVLAKNPVGYWRLDDTTGTVAPDLGSIGRNGQITGGVTLGSAGAIPGSTAMTFNGTNGFLNMGSGYSPINSTDKVFSVEAWVKVAPGASTGSGSLDRMIITRLRTSGFELELDNDNKPKFQFFPASGPTVVINSSVAVDDGEWHHIVGTKGTSYSRIYVDGSIRASGPAPTGLRGGSSFGIGRDANASNGYFNGSLDEVALYDSSLTTGEVRENYMESGRSDTPWCCSGYDYAIPFAEDPVDAASGNFIDTTTDLSAGAATSLSVTRTYNSFDTRGGLFGPGWSTLFDVTAQEVGPNQAEVRTEDGRTARFTGNAVDGWSRPERFDADLTKQGGALVLQWDDGRQWSFDASGRLATIQSPSGETITVARHADGRPDTATSVVGAATRFALTFNYSSTTYPWQGGQPLLETVTTSDGRTIDVHFVSGSHPPLLPVGTLGRVGNPRPTAHGTWATGWWQYSHDSEDLVTRIERTVDAGANPTATTVRTRLKVANSYDTAGRVATQISPDGTTSTFAYGDGTTTVTDSASGDETTYASDDDGKMVGVTDAALAGLTKTWNGAGELAETTDRAGATTKLLYDDQRRLRVRLLPDPVTGTAEWDLQDLANAVAVEAYMENDPYDIYGISVDTLDNLLRREDHWFTSSNAMREAGW